MPDGVTHRRLTYTLLTLTLPSYLYFEPLYVMLTQVGICLTLWINPDNDLYVNKWMKYSAYTWYKEAVTHRRGLYRKNWNKVKWWDLFFFSHLPYAGTVLRFIPVLLLWMIAGMALGLSGTWIAIAALLLYNGMAISDTLHIVADICVSEVHEWQTKN